MKKRRRGPQKGYSESIWIHTLVKSETLVGGGYFSLGNEKSVIFRTSRTNAKGAKQCMW